MKIKIKFLIHFILALFNIIFHLFPIKNKKKIFFFINTEGGFGPSITRSHLLNINFKNNWILFFGTKKDRHNKKITKIFDDRLKFFYCGDLNQPSNRDIFERKMIKILSSLFNIKIQTVESLILKLEIERKIEELDDFNNDKKKKFILFESGFFFKDTISKDFYTNNFYKNNFLRIFKNYGTNFKGRVNFFLRGKGKKYPNKRFIDKIRDSRDIEDYKPTLEYLVENNWQIFLTGEIIKIPDWLEEMNDSIIYQSKTNLDIDDYNLYVMSNSHYFIGGSSGPPLFNCINNSCKSLILETNHIGISYLNSVVSYPKILVDRISDLEEIFMRSPYDDTFLEAIFSKGLIQNLSKNDLKLITKEFFENINNNNYWKTSEDIGFFKTQTSYLNAKISNYWLKLNNLKV